MTVTREEAKEAQQVLAKQLTATFNYAAGSFVNGIGIGVDAKDLYIKVNLTRKATKEEAALLPEECNGVSVKYTVVGRAYKQRL